MTRIKPEQMSPLKPLFRTRGHKPNRYAQLGPLEANELIQELQTYQIELEMQNEELCRTQQELERSRERYIELYELAPVGYLTIDEEGLILEANLAFCQLVNVSRNLIINQSFFHFIAPADRDAAYFFRRSLVQKWQQQVCELRLLKTDGGTCWIRVEATVVRNDAGESIVHAVVSDVTEHKRAESSLLRSAAMQGLLREVAETTVSNVSLEGFYARVHKLVRDTMNAQVFSINLRKATGDEIANVYHVNELNSECKQSPHEQRLTEYIMRLGHGALLTQKDLIPLCGLAGCRAGELKICQYLATPLVDSTGEIYGTIAIELLDETPSYQTEDIEILGIIATQVSMVIQSKRSAEILQKQEENLRYFIENSSDLLYSLTPAGNFEYVAPQIQKLTDFTAAEIIGRPFLDFIHPEDKLRFQSQLQRVMASKAKQAEIEYRFRHKQGEWRLYRASISILRSNADQAISCFAIASDITERRKEADTKREIAEMFLNLLQNVPSVAIQGFNEYGRITYWNQTSERIFGYTSAEAVGQSFIDLMFPVESRPRMAKAVKKIIEIGQSLRASEFIFMRKGGMKVPVFASFTVIHGHNGEINLFCVGFDMSEQKRVEQELAFLCKKAEEASKAKSTFLANMSHELRTPLNAIIGFSEVLKDKLFGPLNRKQEKYVNDVLVSARHQLSLVTDILDLSKVESGKMELEISRINIKELCQTTAAMFRDKASKRKIRLIVNIDTSVDGMSMFADGRRIRQILYNLIDNAIKFNFANGSTTVIVKKEQTETDPPVLQIIVDDTGGGISSENQAKLFKPFSQLSRTYSEQAEGSGLGLALTKHLVELHNGQIELESELGRGSRFIVSIPVRTNQP